MGSIKDPTSTARFSVDAAEWQLAYYLLTFGDAYDDAGAAGFNELQLVIDHRMNTGFAKDTAGDDASGTTMDQFAFVLDNHPKAGVGGDKPYIQRMISTDEEPMFTLYRGDILVFTWTNPDQDDKQRWDLMVGLARL